MRVVAHTAQTESADAWRRQTQMILQQAPLARDAAQRTAVMAYSARAALVCGVDAGFPGAREALSVLEGVVPGNRDVMVREPYWALAPRPAALAP